MKITELQSGDGAVTDNGVFIFPKDKNMDSVNLKAFVDYNEDTLDTDFNENMDMYKGKYPILNQKAKPMNKPDNRIVINFAKYITDIYNGFFIGVPPQITSQDSKINNQLQSFINSNSFADKLSEVAKKTSIFGRCYLFLYQDEDSQTRVAISEPTNSFIVYDDTVAKRPLYFVRYIKKGLSEMTGTLYSATEMIDFGDDCKLATEATTNPYKAVPAIEFVENDERQSSFESVKSIMNGINNAISQKANDVEAIADAYFFLKGGDLDEEKLKDLADNRVLSIDDPDSDAKFLERPNGDGTQENLLDRLEENLFLTAMVTNLNKIDGSSASAASGYSIEMRMQAMRGLASNKERKFTMAIRQLLKLVFGVQEVATQSILQKAVTAITGNTKKDPIEGIEFQFTRNLPKNVADEANTAKTLEGITSKETQFKAIPSLVKDPKAEIKKMQDESNNVVNNAVENNPANYNFGNTSGVNDGQTK